VVFFESPHVTFVGVSCLFFKKMDLLLTVPHANTRGLPRSITHNHDWSAEPFARALAQECANRGVITKTLLATADIHLHG
jgi:hypothetical protein